MPSNSGVPLKSITFSYSKLLVPAIISTVFSQLLKARAVRYKRQDVFPLESLFIYLYLHLWLLIYKNWFAETPFSLVRYIIKTCISFSCCYKYFKINKLLC